MKRRRTVSLKPPTSDDSWAAPSSDNELLLRTYAEARSMDEVEAILAEAKKLIS